MPDLPDVHAKLAFSCVYEKDHLPELPKEADTLFLYARWLQKNNLLKQDTKVYPEIARLYRIAAANGHYKANINLQNGMTDGSLEGSIIEVLDLNDQLVKENIPTGFYNIGYYIEHGYGYDENPELALKYFRKSADMGSPAGQYYVGEKLAPDDMAPDVMRQLRLCAAEQGHAKAGMELGAHFQESKKYAEAVKAYQLGAKAGHEIAAFALENGFLAPPPTDELNYIALEKDEERSRRYKAIGAVLGRYSYLKPTVEEIDDIVPLPPAKLPPWDGSLKWLKAHEANIAPAKPSEELIAKLAKAKGLDPASGMPLALLKKTEVVPPAPAAITTPSRVALGTLCHNGLPCPEAGLWVGYFEGQKYSHLLSKGQLMPTIPASIPRSNKLAQWLKGPEKIELAMEWQLEKYTDA
ncbi:DUF6396 domain-containing protein [Iodobacter sp. CM08]|uniref:SEL1-like repeat protein n=1 Tax=Iodobacter sp. CM08 TaxID=3085902 RepID=UPI0029827EC5|nr:DUF6396 domain-containing protein [Iodobacter sp. CM08]MDW5419202.1 DUF6396 domain-containing protein [Iodobacter sp. CM08]